jgi:hypothetical protein
LLCALLRSREERFGARVVAAFGSELHVSVARVLPTADNIVDGPPTPFPEYAAGLVGRTRWSLRWD